MLILRRPRKAVEQRFYEKTAKSPDGCLLWTANVNPKGYGMFSDENGKIVSAHRWAYKYFVGPVADHLQIDHLCRVRHCVNVEHMEPVTNAENQRRSPLAQAKKTHCPRGHPYDEANTYRHNGRRFCRTCAKLARAAWAKRNPRTRAVRTAGKK